MRRHIIVKCRENDCRFPLNFVVNYLIISCTNSYHVLLCVVLKIQEIFVAENNYLSVAHTEVSFRAE